MINNLMHYRMKNIQLKLPFNFIEKLKRFTYSIINNFQNVQNKQKVFFFIMTIIIKTF